MHRNYKIIDKKVAHNSFSKRRVPVFPAFSETVQVYMDNNVKKYMYFYILIFMDGNNNLKSTTTIIHYKQQQ